MLNHTACMQCCIRHEEAFSIPLSVSLLLSFLFLSFALALSCSLADWPVCSHLRSLICTTGARARMQVWSHVQATNTSRPDSAAPAPRSSMAFSGHGRSLFVMFGADFQGARSDAHVFDLDRRLWRRLETPRFVSGWTSQGFPLYHNVFHLVEATPALTPLHDVMYFWGSEGSGPDFVSLSLTSGLPLTALGLAIPVCLLACFLACLLPCFLPCLLSAGSAWQHDDACYCTGCGCTDSVGAGEWTWTDMHGCGQNGLAKPEYNLLCVLQSSPSAPPSGRSSGAAVAVGSDEAPSVARGESEMLVVHGGRSFQGHKVEWFNDVAIFRNRTRSWHLVSNFSMRGDIPPPRSYFGGAVAIGRAMFLYGGYAVNGSRPGSTGLGWSQGQETDELYRYAIPPECPRQATPEIARTPCLCYAASVHADPAAACRCYKGLTGPDNSVCEACMPGTYKNSIGSAKCAACPADSSSPAASVDASDCTCNAGYTGLIQSGGADGGSCAPCTRGKFKDAPGSSACEMCPASSSSPPGSDDASDCSCNAGFTGLPGACVSCAAGTFKPANGSQVRTALMSCV